MQSKAPKVDEDLARAGHALRALRNRVRVTQAQAAAAHDPEMSPQYWGMHETGRVPGIFKPAIQRALVEALARASGEQLSVDDLADEIGKLGAPGADASRVARLASALSPTDRGGFDPDVREAVFPTSEGDVVVRFPGHMTPEGFKDLEKYLAVFLETKTRQPQ